MMCSQISRYTLFFASIIAIFYSSFAFLHKRDVNSIIQSSFVEHAKRTSNLFYFTIWEDYSFMLQNYDNSAKYSESLQFINFINKSEEFFSGLGLVQAELFTKNDINIFSLNKYQEHKHAIVYHDFNKEDKKNLSYFFDHKGNLVVKAPIIDDGVFSALIELTYDVSETLDSVKFNKIFVGSFIISLFIAITACLCFKLSKSVKILNEQFSINRKLKLAKQGVENLNLKKSKFLANISHELKTPLNSIIGFSALIKDSQDVNQENKSYAKDIYNSGNHLLNLINDILDFSKSELNKLKIKKSLFNIVSLIETCIRMTTTQSPDVKIKTEFYQNEIVVKSDHKRMKQVLLNILSNSVKFTDKTGLIKISAKKEGKELMIEIKDNGIGIAEEDLARALSVFGQSDNDLSRKYDGTGIGLPFSKKLVEMMGGKFVISSKKDSGTVVKIYIPFE